MAQTDLSDRQRSQIQSGPKTPASPRRPNILRLALQVAGLLALTVLTNFGVEQRVALLIEQERWISLGGYAAVWAFCFAALAFTLLIPMTAIRLAVAALVAVSTAAGLLFHRITGCDLTLLDVVSLWNARHEAHRAADMYTADALCAGAAALALFTVLALPAPDFGRRARLWAGRLCWVPLLPLVALAALVWVKGSGTQSTPNQYAPASVALVAGIKMAQAPIPTRGAVTLKRSAPAAATPTPGNIVVLVDESIRADYADTVPTRHAERLVDFGPAASAGVCSHYSNALLRFMPARSEVGRAMLSTPTVWQYAKTAGYRTVYIDAQSQFNKNAGRLQNFMTSAETAFIDKLYTVDESQSTPDLDFWLLDIIKAETAANGPVFIYANKNGAHFPYDRGYPETWRRHRPTMDAATGDPKRAMLNSYRNVVEWSVEHFFDRLFAELPLDGATLIYTSDHGQVLQPGQSTHCSVTAPDPREALVPLFVATASPDARAVLATAAAASHGHGSHFQIAPTVLRLLGFDRDAVASRFGPSLFDANPTEPTFTSGDVFNLVSNGVDWHAIDLGAHYREDAGPISAGGGK